MNSREERPEWGEMSDGNEHLPEDGKNREGDTEGTIEQFGEPGD